MSIAHSKLTTQSQISVPAEIRKKLGVGPGSVLEWLEVVVRKAGRNRSADVHQALFPEGAPVQKRIDVKEAIRRHIRAKHARP